MTSAGSRNEDHLFIVILTWNGHKDTIECLDSIYDGTNVPFEVVVVDNASTDGSVEKFREWASRRGVKIVHDIALDGTLGRKEYPRVGFVDRGLVIIETGRNAGFSAGNNRGIEYALQNDAGPVMVLNNDSIIPAGAIERLRDTLRETPNAGLVYPQIRGVAGELQVPHYQRGPDSFLEMLVWTNVLAHVHPRWKRDAWLKRRDPHPDYAYDAPLVVPNVVSAHSAFRREFLEEIELFDERMFMYHEEDVIRQKMRGTRWVSVLEPRATFIHKGGVDTGKLPKPFLHLEQLKSEMVLAREHLRWGIARRAALKSIRMALYAASMLRHKPYREFASRFFREYARS